MQHLQQMFLNYSHSLDQPIFYVSLCRILQSWLELSTDYFARRCHGVGQNWNRTLLITSRLLCALIRFYVTIAGPYLGKMFLVMVDAYSKFLEIVPMTGGRFQRPGP